MDYGDMLLLQASVAGVERAAQVLNHSGSMQAVGSSAPTGSKLATGNTIIVPQIHGKTPLHILPNQHPQPWELMPLRAAAMRDYPNFLNVSTGFFGSLNRDIKGSMPFCLLKPNRLALDLAKVVTNLGIVASFDLLTHMTHSLQRTPRQRFTAANASSVTPTTAALHHPLRYVRLHLRYDMHRPLWEVAEEQARIGGARRRGVQQQLDEYAAARRASQLEVSQHQCQLRCSGWSLAHSSMLRVTCAVMSPQAPWSSPLAVPFLRHAPAG